MKFICLFFFVLSSNWAVSAPVPVDGLYTSYPIYEAQPSLEGTPETEQEIMADLIRGFKALDAVYLSQINPRFLHVMAVLNEKAQLGDERSKTLLKSIEILSGYYQADDSSIFTEAESEALGIPKTRPIGSSLYPLDLTKSELEEYIEGLKNQSTEVNSTVKEQIQLLESKYTVIERKGDELIGIPYSVKYNFIIQSSLKHLRSAQENAKKIGDENLAIYIEKLMAALLETDVKKMDLAWLDAHEAWVLHNRFSSSSVRVTAGFHEPYIDGFQERKTSWMSTVDLLAPDFDSNDPVVKSALEVLLKYFSDFSGTPLQADSGKQTLLFLNSVFMAGENDGRIIFHASKLPNEEVPSGVIFSIRGNLVQAKGDKVARPLLEKFFVESIAELFTPREYENSTVFHEFFHAFIPKKTLEGEDVSASLGKLNSFIEEGLVEIMSAFGRIHMVEIGHPIVERLQLQSEDHVFADLYSDIMRRAKKGIGPGSSRGQANFLKRIEDAGAISYLRNGKAVVDQAKAKKALKGLMAELFQIILTGDFEKAQEMNAEVVTWFNEKRSLLIKKIVEKTGDLAIDITVEYKTADKLLNRFPENNYSQKIIGPKNNRCSKTITGI